jgi:hypothetical protein
MGTHDLKQKTMRVLRHFRESFADGQTILFAVSVYYVRDIDGYTQREIWATMDVSDEQWGWSYD